MSKRERTKDIQVSLQLHPNIFLGCHISARRQIDTDYLTNALGANLAVTVRTLTGEGPQRVDTLLTGLAVVFVSLTLVDVCVLWGQSETGTRMSECGYCEQTHHRSSLTGRYSVPVGGQTTATPFASFAPDS